MMEARGEFEAMCFEEGDYDLDGVIRLADSQEAAFIFMYLDEEDDKYYRNRYDILECDRGADFMLRRIHRYLEQDELNSIFISFAVVYEGHLRIFNEQARASDEIDLGDAELGENVIYGMNISLVDGQYVFKEVVYEDGGLNQQSWAEELIDAGDLTHLLKNFIVQFA